MNRATSEMGLRDAGYFSLPDLTVLLGMAEDVLRAELTKRKIQLSSRFGVEAVHERDVRKLMSCGSTPAGNSVGNQPGYSWSRLRTLMQRAIAETALDLTGKIIITEAATGAYATTPIIAAMAGADHVYAFTRPTSYGSVEEVSALTGKLAAFCGVSKHITVIDELTPEILASADIVTNCGHLRPLNSDFIDQLPSRAVIALMFEAWEFRPSDIDIDACQRRNIPVVGVNERHPSVDVFSFLGPLCVKQLQDSGLSGYRNRVAVLCDNDFAQFISRGLSNCGAEVELFQFARELPPKDWDAIVIALRPSIEPRIGESEVEHLAAVAPPSAALLQFWGDIDRGAVHRLGLNIWPPAAPSHGHMGILLSALGPEPVVRLQTGGLAAAERVMRGGAAVRDELSQVLELSQ